MKKFLFVILFFVSYCNISLADSKPIVIHNSGIEDDRPINPTYEDMPHVFYDNDTQEITLYGTGVVSYYDVEISSAGTGIVEISTVVGGTYDTIDESSLTAGKGNQKFPVISTRFDL